ncbi:MAG: tyrosine-type recombinase/integrase [Marinilabiliales bacterium]|nr:tyrosine-type recombinase/integrase [Marinilabiliales bacterium]
MPNLENFLSFLKYEKRYSEHTVTAYEKDLDQFIRFGSEMVGDFCLETTDHHLIRQWVISLLDDGISVISVKRKLSSLRSIFKFLLREGHIARNPVELVMIPKSGKKLPGFVEEKEMNQLLETPFFSPDFAGLRDKAVVSVFYGTGMRLSELKSIRLKDVDYAERLVRVLGKRNKERLIPFPAEIGRDLQQYLTARSEMFPESPDFLFLTDKGEPIYEKMIYRIVRKYLEMVTTLEKKSPHVLRHTYATHLLNRGADLNAIKELLGHSTLAATQIYTHTSFEKLKKIYNQAHPRA